MEESEESSRSITRQSSSSSRSRLGLLSQSHSLLNPRQGLLSQTGELLNNPTIHSQSRMGSAHSASSSRTNSVSVQQGNDSRVSVNQPSTSSAQDRLDQSSSTMAEIVTDLRQTLTDTKLVLQFRLFLRTKIDRNKSDDPQYKKMSEQWLDFVNISEQVFQLPEDQNDTKINLMVEIGEKFLGKPPDGYNMALQNQLNRRELKNHCKNLSEKVTSEADDSLLRDGYEYVYGKLDQKHDVFRKTYRPTTRLAALMCTLS
eukprot:TRINITY_DN9565_c0_g1_i1.p1 TRINITY_DN9565_c0_g1~~TRINITY_DN9565_c0_g1_i1.p1  ORF type:complete len:258 (-),score=98.07 TRINITY_DN9565_c0_g1_i1:37-810(-)